MLSNGRITLTLDQKAGGVTSLKLDGVEYAGAAAEDLTFGVPVLERIESGIRTDMFDQVALEEPDWNKAWHTDWKAERDVPAAVAGTKRHCRSRGSATISQSFVLANGDKVEVIYRLLPDDPALQIEAIVTKQPLGEPHAIYLPMPTALGAGWDVDYETGGATVKLDDEQLPYASRHYITTQRFIRIADGKHELTVACPDAPLWQIGGFTFGRFGEPDGRVTRERPTLLAWLTNNYWSTNFQADQGAEIRFRFWLLPSASAGSSANRCRARWPACNRWRRICYAERGPVQREAASLLKLDLGPLLLTRIEPEGTGVALTLLNPRRRAGRGHDRCRRVHAGAGQPHVACRACAGEALPCTQRRGTGDRSRRGPGRASSVYPA